MRIEKFVKKQLLVKGIVRIFDEEGLVISETENDNGITVDFLPSNI